MPYVNRMTNYGHVVTWYKSEGEFVDYGDDMLDIDMQIEDRSVRPLNDRIKTLSEVKKPKTESLSIKEEGQTGGLLVRITSSDRGILGRICEGEGSYAKTGDLLAVMTTERDEFADITAADSEQTSTFRVVASIIF